MSDPQTADARATPAGEAAGPTLKDLITLAVLAAVPWLLSLYLLMWDIPHNLRPTLARANQELPAATEFVIGLARPLPCMAVMAVAAAGVILTLRAKSKAIAWGTLLLGTVVLVGLYLCGYFLLEQPSPRHESMPMAGLVSISSI